MNQIPFTENELRESLRQYKTHTKDLSARTLDVDSFWEEETQMLAEFPEVFQRQECIPELKHLKCLTKWKWAGLWANHAHENSREKLQEVTSEAFQLTKDNPKPDDEAVRKQLDRLSDLTGISAATGTVLLTYWRPEVYTVMDERALSTLSSHGIWSGDTEANIDDYPQYIKLCRAISQEVGLDLRDTDRALWKLGG